MKNFGNITQIISQIRNNIKLFGAWFWKMFLRYPSAILGVVCGEIKYARLQPRREHITHVTSPFIDWDHVYMILINVIEKFSAQKILRFDTAMCGDVLWWRHEVETFFALLALLCKISTGHRWIPLTKASNAELRCFLWSALEQTAEQTIEMPVIWDAIALIMTSL